MRQNPVRICFVLPVVEYTPVMQMTYTTSKVYVAAEYIYKES